ncbi:hypothetical protein SB861_52320 [Paraburkholderia sp. SIMBA_049]
MADEHIAYTTWQTDYMTGVPGGLWAGKFVAVCDPDPPPSRPGRHEVLMSPLSGERIIDRDLVVDRVREGFQAYGLLGKNVFSDALQTSQAGDPILVHRLDRHDTFYYITPFFREDRTLSLMVAVDARTGIYLQSIVGDDLNDRSFMLHNREAAAQQVIGQTIQLPEPLGRIIIRPEAVCQHPTLVWKPCRESLSPFFPFHLFTVGHYGIYVRADGAVFSHLRSDYRGI